MARIMTENQQLLTRYLAAVGCSKAQVLYMMAELWSEEETLEMLQFCKDNPEASPAQLLQACYTISAKYKREEPENEDEALNEEIPNRPSAGFINTLHYIMERESEESK